jgi:Tol biopolymer transport system component
VHDEYVYVTDRRGRYEIWWRSHDGTLEVPVIADADTSQMLGQTLRTPVFSPDGLRIAFERATATGSRVFVSALTGGAPVPMTGAKGTNMAPTWSPNGEEIAFVSGIPGHWTLAKIRVGAATPPVVIREEIKPFTHPVWSPDNHWIAFNTSAGLSLVAPDGGGFRVIDEDAWPVYAWSTDGATLYGIKQDPDNLQWFMLAAIDVASGRERIINRTIAPVRPVNAPVKGFSRTSAGTFVTSFVHVKSDIWLMDDFLPPPGTFERIQNNLRRFSGFLRH